LKERGLRSSLFEKRNSQHRGGKKKRTYGGCKRRKRHGRELHAMERGRGESLLRRAPGKKKLVE